LKRECSKGEPSAVKESDTVTEKERILLKNSSEEEVFSVQQFLPDAENEIMRLSRLNQHTNSNFKDDLFQERKAEIRNGNQNVFELEQLNENLKKVAFDFRMENEKLVLVCETIRQQLEESIADNK
jgi:hypothetical protein